MDVRLPNGVVIKNVPEGTSKDEIRAKAIRSGLATGADFGEPSDAVAQIPRDERYADQPKVEPPKPLSNFDAALAGAAAVPGFAGAAKLAQLASRGSKVAPYLARLAEAVIPKTGKALVADGVLGAVSGVAANEGSKAMPEGWGPVGEIIGGTLGGLGGAAAINSVRNGADFLGNSPALFSSTKDITRQLTDKIGSGAAAKQAATAFNANPDLAPTIARAQQIEKTTGISLPALAAADGDTTISTYIQKQIAKGENTAFTAAMSQQYREAERQLAAARNGMAPNMADVDAYVRLKATQAAKQNEELLKQAAARDKKRVEGEGRIGQRLQELGEQLSNGPTKEGVGERLVNLITAREQGIKKELSPHYEKLLTQSMDAGIMMPGEAAKGIRDFVQQKYADDVFNKFPSLYSTINRVFRPAPTPLSGSKAAQKYTFAKQTDQYKDYSLRDLDSLKRETNEALRNVEPKSDQHRMLLALKKQVDGAIDQTAPEFKDAYRALDRTYAERVGMPFMEDGVVKVKRATFVEDTVPLLTTKASSLKQVMNAMGESPEANQIVQDAFLYDLSNRRNIVSVSTGELNPVQLKAYIHTHRDKIDAVPGLRQKLEGLANKGEELSYHRTQIAESRKRAQQEEVVNLWTKAYGATDGIRGLVRGALKNQSELDKLVNIATNDRVAKRGIQSALLDDVLEAPGDRLELLKANKDAFERLFGRGEVSKIVDIVEASQRLRDNPFALRINVSTINKSKFEEVTGTKFSTSAGEFRNQFISLARSVINHGSRFLQLKADSREAATQQDFLLDKTALQNYAVFMNEIETRGFTDRALSLMGTLLDKSSFRWAMGASIGLGVGINNAANGGVSEEQKARDNNPLLQGYQ